VQKLRHVQRFSQVAESAISKVGDRFGQICQIGKTNQVCNILSIAKEIVEGHFKKILAILVPVDLIFQIADDIDLPDEVLLESLVLVFPGCKLIFEILDKHIGISIAIAVFEVIRHVLQSTYLNNAGLQLGGQLVSYPIHHISPVLISSMETFVVKRLLNAACFTYAIINRGNFV
jgi:hypothetical protein